MSAVVSFDGHDLTSLFVVSHELARGLPKWEPVLVDVPARVGTIYGGTRALPLEITLQLCPRSLDRDTRHESFRTLAGWLAVSEPRQLVLGDEGGRYRLAVPTDTAEITPYLDGDVVEVKLTCPDPRLYGETKTKTVGTSATNVTIGGTAATALTVSVTATPNSSGNWTLTNITTGEYILVKLATGSSHAVAIDCAKRTLTVDGAVKALSTDSDWLVLDPATYSLRVTAGSGTATLSWREMWW